MEKRAPKNPKWSFWPTTASHRGQECPLPKRHMIKGLQEYTWSGRHFQNVHFLQIFSKVDFFIHLGVDSGAGLASLDPCLLNNSALVGSWGGQMEVTWKAGMQSLPTENISGNGTGVMVMGGRPPPHQPPLGFGDSHKALTDPRPTGVTFDFQNANQSLFCKLVTHQGRVTHLKQWYGYGPRSARQVHTIA